MTQQVEEITAKNLDLRLNEGNRKDELALLAVTFNRMLDRLGSSFEAQKEFVSNISHELRTPLTAIIGEIELSLARTAEDDRHREMLENLLADARKLTKLTTDLMNLAKASYDRQSISFQDVRLDEILFDARQALMKSNPCKISLFIEEGPEDLDYLTIKGNAYMLGVAFTNLMHNGCKFSDDNAVSVYIKFGDQNVSISFQDKGTGIPEEDLPHIFEPFFRGKNHNVSGGTGIGLPLVQRIVNLHGGSIEVVSKAGKGSTFHVHLPA